MSTLTQQAALAVNPGFQQRIQAAIVTAAAAILAAAWDPGRPVTSQLRTDLALSVMQDATPWLTRFGWAVAVTPVVANADMSLSGIASTAAGPPAVITTTAAHGLGNGAVVSIAGAVDPVLNGTWQITVISATTFSVPVGGSETGGAGGTVTDQPTDTGISTAVSSVWNDLAGVKINTI